MLRQYSVSGGMERFQLGNKVTTIGSGQCDIVIQDANIDTQHAVVEYRPETRSYWIKDLNTGTGSTLNGTFLYTEKELRAGDRISFGHGPEYVFEGPNPNSARLSAAHTVVGDNGAPPRLLPMRGTPSPSGRAKLIELPADVSHEVLEIDHTYRPLIRPGYRQRMAYRSGSLDRSRSRKVVNAWSADKTTFSVTDTPPSSGGGSSSWDAMMRSAQSSDNAFAYSQMLRRLQSRIVQLEAMLKAQGLDNGNDIIDAAPPLPFTGGSSTGVYPQRKRSLVNLASSNQLLNRIIRLQSELARKDSELQNLREQVEAQQNTPDDVGQTEMVDEAVMALPPHGNGSNAMTPPAIDLGKALEQSEREKAELQVNLSKAEHLLSENARTVSDVSAGRAPDNMAPSLSDSWSIMEINPNRHSEVLKLTNMNLSICRGFLQAIAEDLTECWSKLEIVTPAEGETNDLLYQEIVKLMSRPIEEKIQEYENRCRAVLRDKGVLGDEDAVLLDQLIKESYTRLWQPIIDLLHNIIPVFKDAINTAQKSINAGHIFSEWTREAEEMVSDHEANLTSDFLMESCQELHTRLGIAGAANHWVVTSLMPLVKASSDELKRQMEIKQQQLCDADTNTDISFSDLMIMEERANEQQAAQTENDRKTAELQGDLMDLQLEKASLSNTLSETQTALSQKSTELTNVVERSDAQQVEISELAATIEKLQQESNEYASESELLREKLRLAESHIEESEKRSITDERVLKKQIADFKIEIARRDMETERHRDHLALQEVPRAIENSADDNAAHNGDATTNYVQQNELEELKREKEEKDLLIRELQDRLLAYERSELSAEPQLSVGDAGSSTEVVHETEVAVLREDLEATEQSFWEMSQKLASLLDLDLKRTQQQTNGGVDGDGSAEDSHTKVLSGRHEDRLEAAQELANGVQQLINRVREQNDQLNSHRENGDNTTGLSNGVIDVEHVDPILNGGDDHHPADEEPPMEGRPATSTGKPQNHKMKKTKSQQRQDTAVKIVTFEMPPPKE